MGGFQTAVLQNTNQVPKLAKHWCPGELDDIFHSHPKCKRVQLVSWLKPTWYQVMTYFAEHCRPEGIVYAVEFSLRSGRDLINMAKKRTNVIPIVEDARLPTKYRMLLSQVDVIFADVAQPDQARIVILNAEHFLKEPG
ncbi:hypothetical protein HHX47_DHR6000226 [Lentinula edodes]|nr:hypothetical protein HHX47_DHR6000226 [Lentinula edodes]